MPSKYFAGYLVDSYTIENMLGVKVQVGTGPKALNKTRAHENLVPGTRSVYFKGAFSDHISS